jgi:phosphoglycolate phosphatase-like HAD superfamily hydrolase
MVVSSLRAVFFDVDGVLLDSLPQHLAFCELKAKEYGLSDVRVPSLGVFKEMVSSGVRVSPMVNFFLAVGFPRPEADRAVREYERDFAQWFPPQQFAGIGEMLARLRDAGFSMGLVTSNVRRNVESGLNDVMDYFDARCLFYFDRDAGQKDKRSYLLEGAQVLDLRAESCTYVGDQPGDAAAAHAAGMHFLGVSYGWSFGMGGGGETVVDSVAEIADALIRTSERAGAGKK